MSQSHGSFNGQLMTGNSQTQTVDLIADRGLAYGHGLFETILLQNSQPPLLERHLSRLSRDAKTLGIPVKSSLIQTYLNQFVDHLISENIHNGVLKIVVTAGVGGRGYQSPQPIEPSIICSYASLPAQMDGHKRDGIAVRYCQHRLPNQPALAGIKHLNRLDQVLARQEWDCADYQDGLMFTHTDQLIEAISANVFLKNAAGDWLTPCLQGAGVSGVMRSLLLEEIFPACQIAVQVRAIEMDELAQCQQLFVCNSVRGLIAVTEIYNSQNKLLRSLSADRQTLMLSEKLTEMYPCF